MDKYTEMKNLLNSKEKELEDLKLNQFTLKNTETLEKIKTLIQEIEVLKMQLSIKED